MVTKIWVPGSTGYLFAGFEMDTNPDQDDSGFSARQNPVAITFRNPLSRDVPFAVYWPFPHPSVVGDTAFLLATASLRLRLVQGMRLQSLALYVGERVEPLVELPLSLPNGTDWITLDITFDGLTHLDTSLGFAIRATAASGTKLSVAGVGAEFRTSETLGRG